MCDLKKLQSFFAVAIRQANDRRGLCTMLTRSMSVARLNVEMRGSVNSQACRRSNLFFDEVQTRAHC